MSDRSTFGSSLAAQILEAELRDCGDKKLLPKVSRLISAQLRHLRSFNSIVPEASRIYARQLWRGALPAILGGNDWPDKIRTFTLNVLVSHLKDTAEVEREEV
jgi:hypothetical protein